jgi:SAM-dependent methyltransferase
MDPKLQIRVQRYGWDAASELYEDGWRGPLGPAQQTLLRVADIKPGERVIEAACGSGLVTRAIAEAVGHTGHVLATDLSQNMVDLTARSCADAGYGWVTTARKSADDLGEEGSFDAAVCALGLMYVPDPGKAAASMMRAVRPGGRVVATVWGRAPQLRLGRDFPHRRCARRLRSLPALLRQRCTWLA